MVTRDKVRRAGDVERDAPPRTRRERKRREQPQAKYHVIEIEAMRQTTRYVTSTHDRPLDVERAPKSLHIVRGHFKRFGEQYGTKKLFGRIDGKFWWEKRTRGSIEAGLVESDYSVRP